MHASWGKCWKKKRGTAGFEQMLLAWYGYPLFLSLYKKLLTLRRVCQTILSCHSAGEKKFPFCTYGCARDSLYIKLYEMLDADSLVLLLEVNIKCVAVTECFCTFLCAVDVGLR